MRLLHFRRRLSAAAVAAAPFSSSWHPATIAAVAPAVADESLFNVSIHLPSSSFAHSHITPGQFLPFRLPFAPDSKPCFLSITSAVPSSRPPGEARQVFEFLVKRVPDTTSDLLCAMRSGDFVEVGDVAGKGFDVRRIDLARGIDTVLMFATGSGISPIRSLIESGFKANRRRDVRLYYGARNVQRMAYQDKFNDWESSGVTVIPVLSRPSNDWVGESGYVQTAFARAKQVLTPSSAAAVICGHRQMTEEITSVLVNRGVSLCNILKNI